MNSQELHEARNQALRDMVNPPKKEIDPTTYEFSDDLEIYKQEIESIEWNELKKYATSKRMEVSKLKKPEIIEGLMKIKAGE